MKSFDAGKSTERVTTSAPRKRRAIAVAIRPSRRRSDLEVDELMGPPGVKEQHHEDEVRVDRGLDRPARAAEPPDAVLAVERELDREARGAVERDEDDRRDRARRDARVGRH